MITNDDTQPVTFASYKLSKKMLAILQATSETLDGLCLTHNGSWCFSAWLARTLRRSYTTNYSKDKTAISSG